MTARIARGVASDEFKKLSNPSCYLPLLIFEDVSQFSASGIGVSNTISTACLYVAPPSLILNTILYLRPFSISLADGASIHLNAIQGDFSSEILSALFKSASELVL